MRKRYSTSEKKEQELLTARKKVNLKMLSKLCWMFTCVPCSRSLILLTMLLKKTLLCLTSILELQQFKVFEEENAWKWIHHQSTRSPKEWHGWTSSPILVGALASVLASALSLLLRSSTGLALSFVKISQRANKLENKESATSWTKFFKFSWSHYTSPSFTSW